MALSDDQVKAVESWLKKNNVECPICKCVNIEYHREFFNSSKQMTSAGVISRDETDFVGYDCGGCGYFWLIDAQVARIPRN